MDDAINIYQTDDRNIVYTNHTNIKHASMRSYDYSAGASLCHCMNKCFDGEDVSSPLTFKKQIQESFLWKMWAFKILLCRMATC